MLVSAHRACCTREVRPFNSVVLSWNDEAMPDIHRYYIGRGSTRLMQESDIDARGLRAQSVLGAAWPFIFVYDNGTAQAENWSNGYRDSLTSTYNAVDCWLHSSAVPPCLPGVG